MLKIDIFNETTEKIDKDAVETTVIKTFSKLFSAQHSEIEIIFCNKKKITELNRKYLRRVGSTDIISFPNANPDQSLISLGSLVICPAIVKQYKESLDEVIIHGMIHLAGYNHETAPKAWQEVLDKINK